MAGRYPWSYHDSANSICCWHIYQHSDFCKYASGFLRLMFFQSGSSNTEGTEKNSCIFCQPWNFHISITFSRWVPSNLGGQVDHLTWSWLISLNSIQDLFQLTWRHKMLLIYQPKPYKYRALALPLAFISTHILLLTSPRFSFRKQLLSHHCVASRCFGFGQDFLNLCHRTGLRLV